MATRTRSLSLSHMLSLTHWVEVVELPELARVPCIEVAVYGLLDDANGVVGLVMEVCSDFVENVVCNSRGMRMRMRIAD